MANNNEYFDCLQIVFYTTKIVGIFPFTVLRKGSWIWLLVSYISTAISLFIYFMTLPAEIEYIIESFDSVYSGFNFNFFVRIIPTITSRILVMMMPFIIWNTSKKLHDYWDNWMHYQNEVEKITGIPYFCPIKKRIWGISLIGILLVFLTAVISRARYVNQLMTQTHTPSILYVALILHTIPLYWYVNCMFMKSAGKTITQLVQIYTFDGSDTKLHHLIHLWIVLCDLNKEFNTSHSILFLGYLTFSVINIIASTYSALFLFIFETNKTLSITYFVNASVSIVAIFVFCESANSVSRQFSWEILQTILNRNMSKMNGRLLRSVVFFLQMIDTRKPEIIVNGFLILNRSSIVAIYAAVVNYLIILKQFNYT